MAALSACCRTLPWEKSPKALSACADGLVSPGQPGRTAHGGVVCQQKHLQKETQVLAVQSGACVVASPGGTQRPGGAAVPGAGVCAGQGHGAGTGKRVVLSDTG